MLLVRIYKYLSQPIEECGMGLLNYGRQWREWKAKASCRGDVPSVAEELHFANCSNLAKKARARTRAWKYLWKMKMSAWSDAVSVDVQRSL